MALVIHHMIQLIKLYYLVSGFVLTLKINNIEIMKAINLNELKDRAYRIACEHGFHDEEYSNEHFLALTITELSEAIEADRNNKRANIEQFEVDKNLATELLVSDDSYFVTSYQKNIKGTIEEELADVFIRLLDLFGTLSLDE